MPQSKELPLTASPLSGHLEFPGTQECQGEVCLSPLRARGRRARSRETSESPWWPRVTGPISEWDGVTRHLAYMQPLPQARDSFKGGDGIEISRGREYLVFKSTFDVLLVY